MPARCRQSRPGAAQTVCRAGRGHVRGHASHDRRCTALHTACAAPGGLATLHIQLHTTALHGSLTMLKGDSWRSVKNKKKKRREARGRAGQNTECGGGGKEEEKSWEGRLAPESPCSCDRCTSAPPRSAPPSAPSGSFAASFVEPPSFFVAVCVDEGKMSRSQVMTR